MAFAKPEENEIAYAEIVEIENLTESIEKQCINWLPMRKPKTDFMILPADINKHRKVNIPKEQYSKEAKSKLDDILQNFNIISKSSSEIGTTPLISMDIDTGDSPPVSQRHYTLPLKCHEWVKSKIETLEDTGVIRKSFSPWASPIVVFPKKSEKGEPMKRRMCVDFRKINALQPKQ